jgi:hypothetical protein
MGAHLITNTGAPRAIDDSGSRGCRDVSWMIWHQQHQLNILAIVVIRLVCFMTKASHGAANLRVWWTLRATCVIVDANYWWHTYAVPSNDEHCHGMGSSAHVLLHIVPAGLLTGSVFVDVLCTALFLPPPPHHRPSTTAITQDDRQVAFDVMGETDGAEEEKDSGAEDNADTPTHSVHTTSVMHTSRRMNERGYRNGGGRGKKHRSAQPGEQQGVPIEQEHTDGGGSSINVQSTTAVHTITSGLMGSRTRNQNSSALHISRTSIAHTRGMQQQQQQHNRTPAMLHSSSPPVGYSRYTLSSAHSSVNANQ